MYPLLTHCVPSILTFARRNSQYELRLTASDNLKENHTTVVIHVKDVNDNPPVFERPTYRTQITEEDDRNLPKRVLQVLHRLPFNSPTTFDIFSCCSTTLF
jgi:hypothetical protein